MIKSPKFCLVLRFSDYNFVCCSPLPYVPFQYSFIFVFLSFSPCSILAFDSYRKYFVFTLNFACTQHLGIFNATYNDRILHRVEQNKKFLNPATSNEAICLLRVVRVLVCVTNPLNNPTTITG